jgi:hypothetical protein
MLEESDQGGDPERKGDAEDGRERGPIPARTPELRRERDTRRARGRG